MCYIDDWTKLIKISDSHFIAKFPFFVCLSRKSFCIVLYGVKIKKVALCIGNQIILWRENLLIKNLQSLAKYCSESDSLDVSSLSLTKESSNLASTLPFVSQPFDTCVPLLHGSATAVFIVESCCLPNLISQDNSKSSVHPLNLFNNGVLASTPFHTHAIVRAETSSHGHSNGSYDKTDLDTTILPRQVKHNGRSQKLLCIFFSQVVESKAKRKVSLSGCETRIPWHVSTRKIAAFFKFIPSANGWHFG